MKQGETVINSFVIDSAMSGPKVLIIAGVHGDEYEPVLSVLRLKRTLSEVLSRGSVILVPVVHMDALMRSTRTGSDALDLARTCPGNPKGSPTEVAAAAVSVLIRSADYLVDLHTGGRNLDIYPLAGYMLHAVPEILDRQRGMARAFNLPVTWGTDDKLEGRTLSVARDAGVPAIYVEYGGGGRIREEIVAAYVEGCVRVLGHLGMTEPSATQTPRLKYSVEDATPDAGYLQRKMPAPFAGIFLPEVEIGSLVEKGQRWGTIVGVEDGAIHEIYSASAGLALFRRTAGYVDEADALGGVIDIRKSSQTFK